MYSATRADRPLGAQGEAGGRGVGGWVIVGQRKSRKEGITKAKSPRDTSHFRILLLIVSD